MSSPVFVAIAQNSNDRTQGVPFHPGQVLKQRKLPPNARIGSTPERKAALENLTPIERENVRKMFNDIVAKAAKNEELKKRYKEEEPTSLPLVFSDKDGNRQVRTSRNLNPKGDRLTSVLKIKGTNQHPNLASMKVESDSKAAVASFDKSRDLELRAHATRTRTTTSPAAQTSCTKTIGQFVKDFYQGGVVRQPKPWESHDWTTALAQAQQQGSAQTLAVAQSLGYTIFQSQEYANRGRSDSEYIYDLYKGWLQREPDQSGWDFWLNQVYQHGRAAVLPAFPLSIEFGENVALLCSAASYDADTDALPDNFEDQVGDAFTPYYHISGGETNQFATFQDNTNVPETIKQYFGQTPVSHFRVHKEGFATNASGALVSVLRIDYLTLLDGDSGLVGSGACAFNFLGLGGFVASFTGHFLDHERSAMLVAAPVSTYEYNLNPAAYSIYNIYTAGHEFTLGDTSMYANYFNNPVPAFNHVMLALSRSKHATYGFNPDWFMLTPWYIMDSTYQEIDNLYWYGYIPWWVYFSLLATADDLFFLCLVERFNDIGGQYSGVRINVGEIGNPINNSSFIAVPGINSKFTTPYYRW
jgi:hypothetical protein